MIEDKAFNVLRRCALFKDMEDDKIRGFLADCEFENFEKKRVFTEKELESFIFIPIEGCVKSYQINHITAKEYIIFLFKQSDVFDIITFIDQREHEVIFETLKESSFVKISHQVMDTWIERDPHLSRNLIYLLSDMLQRLEQNASDLALYDTLTRLARLILRHVSPKLSSPKVQRKIKLNHVHSLSHEHIAQMIGTVREVVSRHIKTLKKENVLKTDKGKQHIIDLENLIKHCHLDK